MIWLLIQAAAVTLVITEGSIFGRLRTFGPQLWRQLISCSLCLGVWVGALFYGLQRAQNVDWTKFVLLEWFGFSCVSGVLAFIAAMFIACLDRLSGPDPEVLPAPQVLPQPSHPVAKSVPPSPEVLKIPPQVGQ